MKAKNILLTIYTSAEIKYCIDRLPNRYDKEDVLQHVFLELFSMDEAKIIDLYNRNKLRHYIVKMLYNTSKFTRTSFAKQYGKETPTEYFPDIAQPEEEEETIISLDCLPVCKSGLPYMAELLKLYAEHKTYQKVADITGINATSVFNTIKEAKKIIIKHLKNESIS